MLINRRVTNGLAWAGLCLVVGVPTADFVSGQLMGEPQEAAVAAVLTPAVAEATIIAPIPAPLSQRPAAPKPVETAAAKPAEPAKVTAPATEEVASAGNVVDDFLATGRSLPSYITDAAAPAQPVAPAKPATVAATPQPVVSAPAKPVTVNPTAPAAPSQTAAAPSPISPLPGSPAQPITAPTDPVEVAAIGPQKIAPVPMPLSMRPKPVEPVFAPQTAAAAGEAIVIPADVGRRNDGRVTEDDLADWEYGPLDDFLARREGRDVEADAGSRATVTYGNGAVYPPAYVQRPRRDVYVGPIEQDFFFPFVN